MISTYHIWNWDLAKKIAEEKWTTPYKTEVWNEPIKDLKIARKKWGEEFVVLYNWKWQRLSGWTPNKKWVELFIVGNENNVDISGLPIRQVFMKCPSELWIYSISDMWEYHIETELVDEGDWPWYYTARYDYVVNKYGKHKISYISKDDCKMVRSYLDNLQIWTIKTQWS